LSSFQPSVLEDSVLVVDDDQATRESLASVLKGAGIEVFVASDPNEALTLHGLQRPAAVVVDHQLADHTGVDLAQRLKEVDPDTPVLLLTGLASLDSALAASAHLDGLLVKPLVPQAFVQTVRNALAQRALAVENHRLGRVIEEMTVQAQSAPPPPAPAAPEAEPVAPPPTIAPEPAPEVFAESPSRALLEDQLEKALVAAQRAGSSLAVLFVELDGWQEVNQQFGAGAAEQVAREVASRLAVARRKTDIVTRVANEKFVVACADVHSDADALRIASLILDGAARPIIVHGVEHRLRPTVGIVLTDPAGPPETADNVLENAELAMYQARDEGGATRMFDPTMRERVVSRYEIEHGLQNAMDNGELALFYQPVVDLHSGQVVGAEALLRWQRPEQGLLLPGEFLDVAGEVGMAEALGRWTLDRALTELVLWRQAENLPEQFRLTLNVSAREIGDPRFAQTFEELTRKHGVAPTMLSIDLSNDAARVAVGNGSAAVAQLSQMGVRFNLDDFGVGECSLTWLQKLPITSLKIAPEFVGALDSTSNPHGAVMVRALIALGHELRLSLVAEGVETPAQAAALRVIGCEFAQGYHLGHPGPREQVWAAPEA
jgi:diguanylate cyclase (GGDEF)-like protein